MAVKIEGEVQFSNRLLQTGMSPADRRVDWGVVKIVDSFSYDVLFTPDVANRAELIPGYMHVRGP